MWAKNPVSKFTGGFSAHLHWIRQSPSYGLVLSTYYIKIPSKSIVLVVFVSNFQPSKSRSCHNFIFFGTLRQTAIWQTRQSDKHKRKSGRQENPTNSGQRQSGKQDNLRGLVVPYLPVCRSVFRQCLSDCPVCRIFLHENPAN